MAILPTNFRGETGYKVIDVSDKPVESELLRDGYKVPAINLNEDRVANIIADGLLDDRAIQPRVVYQSVRAGTRIPRGTAIDIVLASPFLVDVDVLPGAHIDLIPQNMGTVADVYLADTEVRHAIQMANSYDELPPAVQVQLVQTASQNDVRVVEGTPGQDGNALFTVLQAANTYS